jgi:hypothetical protein
MLQTPSQQPLPLRQINMFKNVTSFIITAVLTAGVAMTVTAAPASDHLKERASVCQFCIQTGHF